MRFPLAVLAAICATSAFAAELPISGIYGDEAGCARLMPSDRPDEPGGFNLYADPLEGYEWGCSFADVWTYSGGRSYAVQGLCSAEGVPFLEQYVVEPEPDNPARITIYQGDGERWWQVRLCENIETPGRKG